jgi:hypothetical protein
MGAYLVVTLLPVIPCVFAARMSRLNKEEGEEEEELARTAHRYYTLPPTLHGPRGRCAQVVELTYR